MADHDSRRSDEFGGRQFTAEDRQKLHWLAEHEEELKKLVEVSRAKKFLWDVILKAAAGVTVLIGAIIAFNQWRAGP